MPNLFVVIADSDICPKLYVSQQGLTETLRSLRAFPYSHVNTSFVFEVRVIPNVGNYDPLNCAQLALVARVDPSDQSEHCRYSLTSALDRLPPEQAMLEAQRAIDLIMKKMLEFENKLKPEVLA